MNITDTGTSSKIKIAIVGLGGVGGYYGGLLSRYAEAHPELEVTFIVRGDNLQQIKKEGLKVITETETFNTRPALATDDPSQAGKMDYVILATKSYDLSATVEQIRPMLTKHTIVLPLLNGIDITTRLREMLPENEIWYGCVYIVTRLNKPGEVESSGNVHYFHFGHEKQSSPELLTMEKLLIDAGIEATRKEDPVKAIWRKYFYISPTASLTTYLNTGFRDLVWDADKKPVYVALMRELLSIAHAEGVDLPESLIDDMLRYGGGLPAGTTSSMNSDYLAGKRIEIETLTGVVIKLGEKHGILTPEYKRILFKLTINN